MRRLCLMLALLLLPIGCMPSQNLDDYAYVLNIGAERGTTMPYLLTFLVSAPGEGEEQTGVRNVVISAEARSLSEAVRTLNAAYSSRLSFSRASLLLLGEDLVQDGAQTPLLDLSFGAADLWPNLRVAVCEGSVKETFEGWISQSDPSLRKIKTSVGELMTRAGMTSDIGYSTYLECANDERIDALIAYAGRTEWTLREDSVGNETYPTLGGALLVSSTLASSTAGSAVFDGDRMVGVLDGLHTMAVLMVTDAFQSGELICTAQDGRMIEVKLRRVKRPRMSVENGQATAELFLEADVISPASDPIAEEALTALLETELASMLREVYDALRGMNSDAMGFGREAAKRFSTVEAWEAFDWKAEYRQMPCTFTAHVRLADARGGER